MMFLPLLPDFCTVNGYSCCWAFAWKPKIRKIRMIVSALFMFLNLRCFPFDTKLGKMLHEFLFSFVQ